MYVWEFFNNFNDFLKSKEFKIEELQAALSFTQKAEDVKIYNYEDEDEMNWDEKVSQASVAEQGFSLVSSLHITLLNCFLD